MVNNKPVHKAETNYFCEWERIAEGSPVFGIVWDTDIRYGWAFIDENSAIFQVDKMKRYDSRGKYEARLFSMREYKKLYQKFADVE